MTTPNGISIRFNHKGGALYADKDFKKGDVIFEFLGTPKPIDIADKRGLQIDENNLLESSSGFDDYLNHSCDPNGYIKFTDKILLIAKRKIKQGEELSFNYNTTEYDLLRQGVSFDCRCGKSCCQNKISGFKHLETREKRRLKNMLSPYLLAILFQEEKTTSKLLPQNQILQTT